VAGKLRIFLIVGAWMIAAGAQALAPSAWAISTTTAAPPPPSPTERIKELESRRALIALERNTLRDTDTNVAEWHLALNQRAAFRAKILKDEFGVNGSQDVVSDVEPEIFIWMVDRRFERAELQRTRLLQRPANSQARAHLTEIEQKMAALKASDSAGIEKYEEFRRRIESAISAEFLLWRTLPKEQRPMFFKTCGALLRLPRAATPRK
jgi:hypothetical protein